MSKLSGFELIYGFEFILFICQVKGLEFIYELRDMPQSLQSSQAFSCHWSIFYFSSLNMANNLLFSQDEAIWQKLQMTNYRFCLEPVRQLIYSPLTAYKNPASIFNAVTVWMFFKPTMKSYSEKPTVHCLFSDWKSVHDVDSSFHNLGACGQESAEKMSVGHRGSIWGWD